MWPVYACEFVMMGSLATISSYFYFTTCNSVESAKYYAKIQNLAQIVIKLGVGHSACRVDIGATFSEDPRSL